MNLKRIFIGLFLIMFTVSSLGISPDESFAGAHPNAKIKDGNATQKIGKGYDPTDVNPDIKNRYEKGIMKDFVLGGKHPEKTYNPNKGNRLGYDVYLGVTNSPTKKPLRIETHGGKDYLVFDGWSAIQGYYHHDRYNQVTYIGAINLTKDGKERKIYKAQMTNMNAYNDLKYNFLGKNKMCPDSGRDAHLKFPSECNMEYKWVGFRAYLPLDDLFPKNGENNVWALEIIKGVKGHGYTPSNTISGARYVYDSLVIPYDTKKLSWSKNHANVIVSSGTDLRWLTMSGSGVIRRAVPRSNDRSERGKHFVLGNRYLWRTQDEKAGVAIWHGVRSPHDNNKTRYTSSMFWDFGGDQAIVKLEKTHFDVTVKHVDKNSGKTLLNEGTKKYKRGSYTFKPKEKGYFKTPEGYEYVPLDKSKKVEVNKDKEITFYYKASIPDPSRIVEQDGGQKTHGHASGQAEWKLDKEDERIELPDPNENDFEYKNVSGGVEITNYTGTNKNVIIPEKIGGKNVVSIGDGAFAEKGISSVKIPETVSKIGNGAFKNNNLTTIFIPENVREIQVEAFMSNRITEITLPDGIESIEARAFFGNAIEKLEVGESLTRIGESAFANNALGELNFHHTNLRYIESYAFLNNEISSVVLNEGLIRIGDYAFTGNALIEIRLPESVEEVGSYAFANNNIKDFVVYNEFLRFGEGVFVSNQENPKDLMIYGYVPSTAKDYADKNNHSFKDLYDDYDYVEIDGGVEITGYNGEEYELVIPRKLGGKNVVSIGANAFENKALTSVVLPSTVHTIKELAFANNKLTSIDLSNVKEIGTGAFMNNDLQDVVFGNGLEKIGNMSFRNNKLTSVNVLGKVTVIEANAFEENNLKNVTFNNNITEIGERAFAINELEEIVLPKNLKVIGDQAFWNNSIKEIILPVSLEKVGNRSFEYNKITKVEVRKHNLEFGESVFNANTESAKDLKIYGYCGSTASEYATIFGHTFVDFDGNDCPIYVYATNGDFEFVPSNDEGAYYKEDVKGYYRYVGNDEYVIIPEEIQGDNVTSYYKMFENSSVKGVISKNPNVTNMRSMFENHKGETLDISGLNTSNVTDMSFMFKGSEAKQIKGLDNFETSNVINMESMFKDANIDVLDLSSFDLSKVTNMTNMLENVKATKGYARTQKDLDKLNNDTVTKKPEYLLIELKGDDIEFNKNSVDEKPRFIDTRSLSQKVLDFFIKPETANADAVVKESMTKLISNFIVTGNHADVRNVKHTIKVGNKTETSTKPFAILIDPAQTKNKDMEYDFEYEYTNHVKLTYKCTDKLGDDCFAWKLDKAEPVWKAPYVKKFKLSDTAGEFERYATSRLGRINHANALIYSSLDDNEPKRAGNDLLGRTFYIKEKAVKGNDVRYLISTHASNTEGVIGWVNELDMTTYTHYQMDRKTKTFKLTGKGKAYNMIWGGNQQEAGIDLSKQKDREFVVNMTETVGDNIWYRGKIDGKGNNVWIHKNHTTSNEIIKINEVPETPLNNVNNNFAKLTLKMNHKHGEELKFTKNTDNKAKLLVGRNARHDEFRITTSTFEETIEVDRKDTKLETQTWKEIKHTFKYNSDFGNRFFVIDGDKYYYPYDLDENLREKYRNNTEHNYGKYAIPLRVSDEKHHELEFKSADNFFITKKTGFQFSLPHHEVSTVVIKEQAKEQYEAFTGNKYDKDDTVISDPFDASRYYLNIALDGEQKPNKKYSDNVVLGRLGLSDVTVHLMQDLEFERYLVGHYKDEPVMVEQKTSVIKGIEYTNEVTLTPEKIKELKRIQKEREGVIHSFRKTDDAEIIDKVKGVTP